jgi:hypothetical protein
VSDRATLPASDVTTSLPRSAQTLPVPLGGLAPVHRGSTALGRILRRQRTASLLAFALIAAGSGVWLSTSPRSFDAGNDAAGVHIGDILLTPVAQSTSGLHVFTGAAALAIATASDGTMRAGAVMTWNGVSTTARCELRPGDAGAEETCHYDMGPIRLTSTDSYAARMRTWRRRYGDGVEITITVPSGTALIPIPFPLGR